MPHKYIPVKELGEYRCLTGEQPTKYTDFSVKALVDMHLLAKQGEERESGGWVHPSSMAYCLRALFYSHCNVPAVNRREPSTLKLMACGSALHTVFQDWIAEAIIARGEEFEAEVPIRFEPYRVSGRIDGLFSAYDWLLEIKTVGTAGFPRLTSPRKSDKIQAHVYMFILDIPRIIMYYINRDTGEDKEHKLFFDRDFWNAEVSAKFLGIIEAVDNDKPPPRQTSSYHCRECNFYDACMRDER